MTNYTMYPNTSIYANGHLIELGDWSGSYNPTTGQYYASYPIRIDGGAWNTINNISVKAVSVSGVTVTMIGNNIIGNTALMAIDAVPIAASTTTPTAVAAINASTDAAVAAAIESAVADYMAGKISAEQYNVVVASIQEAAPTITQTTTTAGGTIAKTGVPPKSDNTGVYILLGLGALALMFFMKGK